MTVSQLNSLFSQPLDHKIIQVVNIYCIYEDYKFALLAQKEKLTAYLRSILGRPKLDLVYEGQLVNKQLRCVLNTLINLMQDSNELHKRYMLENYEMNDKQYKDFEKLQS